MIRKKGGILDPKKVVWISFSIIFSLCMLIMYLFWDMNQIYNKMSSTYGENVTALQKVMYSLEAVVIFTLVTCIILLFFNYFSRFRHESLLRTKNQEITSLETLPLTDIALSIGQMIVEQRRIEEELRTREEWLSTALQSIAHAVITADDKEKVTFINPTAERLTGWKKKEAEGSDLSSIIGQPIPSRSDKNFTFHSQLITKHGRNVDIEASMAPMKNKKDKLIGSVFVIQDVTEKKKIEEAIKNQAFTDELTGLPNRRYLQQEILRLEQLNQPLAILFVDLDRFKFVNDSFGHEVGDLLLKKVAERLKLSVGKQDLVVRWAGDEFIVVLFNVQKPQAVELAQRVLEDMREPFLLKGYKLVITPSIGITLYPDDAENISDLVTKADLAMYNAKKSGKNSIKCYEA